MIHSSAFSLNRPQPCALVLVGSLLGLLAGACGGDEDDGNSDGSEMLIGGGGDDDSDGLLEPGDGSGDGPTTGDVDGDSACADSSTYVGRSGPSALQLVVDTSCSMASDPGQGGGFGQQGGNSGNCDNEDSPRPFSCGNAGNGSKWQITRDALIDSFGNLSPTTQIGLSFYPFPPGTPAEQIFAGDRCDCFPDVNFFVAEDTVPLGPLTEGQRSMLETALGSAVVSGSTPTHAAYLQAAQYLGASSFDGSKYIVLLTDGDPTYGLTDEGSCTGNGISRVDSSNLIEDVGGAYANGISTFVIGSPGSENARSDLSRMAEVGGTARNGCSSDQGSDLYCHLDMTTEPDFGSALAEALGEVVELAEDPCTYILPTPPDGQTIDRTRVNVSYMDGAGEKVEIGRDPTDTECNTGWQYTADQNAIQLCDDVCQTVLSSGNTDVDILVGCRATTRGEPAR